MCAIPSGLDVSSDEQQRMVGTEFIAALTGLDFERLQACFDPDVKFRALVPSGLREGQSASEATMWVRRWFGAKHELNLENTSVDRIGDKLHIAYRLHVREQADWRVVEQQAYCTVRDGRIADMNLLCSGFWPELSGRRHDQPTRSHADAYYDAGDRGCAEGPLDEIALLMRGLAPGQTLEVKANDPSVGKDLPAWCRLVGHEVVTHEGNRYLIRHK